MRRAIALIVVCFALSFASPAQSPKFYGAAPTDPLTASLLVKEQALMTAVLHRDVAAFSGQLTTDFVLVNTEGRNSSRFELFGDGELKGYSIYEPQAVPLDDDAVVFSYNAIVQQPPADEDQRIPRYQRITTIWVRQGGDWKQKFRQAAALQVGS